MKVDLVEEIELLEGVTSKLEGSIVTVKGPKGEIKRDFGFPKIEISVDQRKIVLSSHKATKKEKTILMAFLAHLRNMVKGVKEPHVYKLKICSSHFPITVGVVGKELVVKNFLGESIPRKTSIPAGVEVKVSGSDISVSSPDKELAGMTAARIENLCRITNRDIRVFQDGCYITNKAGKDLAI